MLSTGPMTPSNGRAQERTTFQRFDTGDRLPAAGFDSLTAGCQGSAQSGSEPGGVHCSAFAASTGERFSPWPLIRFFIPIVSPQVAFAVANKHDPWWYYGHSVSRFGFNLGPAKSDGVSGGQVAVNLPILLGTTPCPVCPANASLDYSSGWRVVIACHRRASIPWSQAARRRATPKPYNCRRVELSAKERERRLAELRSGNRKSRRGTSMKSWPARIRSPRSATCPTPPSPSCCWARTRARPRSWWSLEFATAGHGREEPRLRHAPLADRPPRNPRRQRHRVRHPAAGADADRLRRQALAAVQARPRPRTLKAAFAAMDRRNFKTPAYTNIYLMRAVSMILLGEAVADAKAADTGYAQLDAWIAYTRKAGIHEFDSPTYYCTDLNSLRHRLPLRRPPGRGRSSGRSSIISGPTSPPTTSSPTSCLTGPHSRNYDFLHSWGGLDFYLYAEGFCRRQPRPPPGPGESVRCCWRASEKAYHPPQNLYALAAEPRAWSESRWDTDPNRTRYNYITPDFAIGSASGGDYGAAGQADRRRSWRRRRNCRSWRSSPTRPTPPTGRKRHSTGPATPSRPTCRCGRWRCRRRGRMLALLDLDVQRCPPRRGALPPTSCCPRRPTRSRWTAGASRRRREFEQPAPLDSVVGVREGNAGVAIRVFQADGWRARKPRRC